MSIKPVLCDPYRVSVCCKDQTCALCGCPAAIKVVDEQPIHPNDTSFFRHALSAYLCEVHFLQLAGPTMMMSVEDYRNHQQLMCRNG